MSGRNVTLLILVMAALLGGLVGVAIAEKCNKRFDRLNAEIAELRETVSSFHPE